jgi:hypothetical protein
MSKKRKTAVIGLKRLKEAFVLCFTAMLLCGSQYLPLQKIFYQLLKSKTTSLKPANLF